MKTNLSKKIRRKVVSLVLVVAVVFAGIPNFTIAEIGSLTHDYVKKYYTDIYDKNIKKYSILNAFLYADSINGLIQDIRSAKVIAKDNLVEIDLIRGNKFPDTYSQLDSSNTELIIHILNQPSYLDIAEYGL